MMDGADVELGGLDAAKSALYVRQTLVGADHIRRGHLVGRYRRADDVDAIKGSFRSDGRLVALPPE